MKRNSLFVLAVVLAMLLGIGCNNKGQSSEETTVAKLELIAKSAADKAVDQYVTAHPSALSDSTVKQLVETVNWMAAAINIVDSMTVRAIIVGDSVIIDTTYDVHHAGFVGHMSSCKSVIGYVVYTGTADSTGQFKLGQPVSVTAKQFVTKTAVKPVTTTAATSSPTGTTIQTTTTASTSATPPVSAVSPATSTDPMADLEARAAKLNDKKASKTTSR